MLAFDETRHRGEGQSLGSGGSCGTRTAPLLRCLFDAIRDRKRTYRMHEGRRNLHTHASSETTYILQRTQRARRTRGAARRGDGRNGRILGYAGTQTPMSKVRQRVGSAAGRKRKIPTTRRPRRYAFLIGSAFSQSCAPAPRSVGEDAGSAGAATGVCGGIGDSHGARAGSGSAEMQIPGARWDMIARAH